MIHGHKTPLYIVLSLVLTAALPGRGEAPAGDLLIDTGDDGDLSTWLILGPLESPPGVKRRPGGLAGWDPAGISGEGTTVSEGASAAGGRWSVYGSDLGRVRLKGGRPGVAYLAVVIESQDARRMILSTGSSGGLQVLLNGETVATRDLKRKAKPDTDLVELSLRPGDNLLVLRTWTASKRGAWLVHARLLDEDLARPKDVRLRLPGAVGAKDELSKRARRLRVERSVDLEAATVHATIWAEYRGGGPSPLGDSGLPFSLLHDEVYAAKIPASVQVETPLGAASVSLGVRMRDVVALSEAYKSFCAGRGSKDVPRTSVESVEWRIDHLRSLLEAGDPDRRYLEREIRRTAELAAALARGEDPYRDERGDVQRRGYRSSVDGRLHSYALYVPHAWRDGAQKPFPLVVSLHGLNSMPMKAMTSLFGIPMAERETRIKRERHPPKLGRARVFAVAPEGFGNSGYRQYGERDVEEVIARVRERYPIDPDRIYVTGASMGGTGTAIMALRHPSVFAAAAPLCGYHNLDVYNSLRGVKLRPWETFLKEMRSNDRWAANGRHIPLYVVHGTKDNPRHSDSLVDQYRRRGFRVRYENPEAGHNVWDATYAERRIFDHFSHFRRPAAPRKVSLVTARLRYRENRWLRVDAAADSSRWVRLDGVWAKDGRVEITTENTAALTVLVGGAPDGGAAKVFVLDGQEIPAGAAKDGEWSFARSGDKWSSGALQTGGGFHKRPGLAGPMDDVFYEPLLFVYATGNEELAAAKRTAQRMRLRRPGATVDWPVKADTEVTAKDISEHSLVLIGTPSGNGVLSRIADALPVRVEKGAVRIGDERFEGSRVAASFVYPNPLNPDRYVMVHTGVTSLAYAASASLPDLLPDYLVYDATDWGRSRGLVLDDREILAGGFFDERWRYQKP